jgi:hypothetical protein
MLSPENYYAKQPPFTGNTVTEIDVPSGKLITADSLCSVEHFDIEMPLSIESGVGLDAWARLFAEQANTAYAFVGNSSPLITQQADASVEVVNPEWGDGPDVPDLNADEVIVARVITDVWATMLTDYRNWVDHGGIAMETRHGGLSGTRFTVFAIPAGKYRWTVFAHADGFDMHAAAGRVTYARLECIERY